jgi:hypothetical protein
VTRDHTSAAFVYKGLLHLLANVIFRRSSEEFDDLAVNMYCGLGTSKEDTLVD